MTFDTHEQLAAELGVAKQRLYVWRRRGLPLADQGPYDPDAVLSWIRANMPRSPLAGDPDEASEWAEMKRRKLAAVVRHLEAQADIEERKAKRMKAALLRRTELDAERAAMVDTIRGAFAALPAEHAGKFVGLESMPEAEEKLAGILTATLEVLSE